ncbi:MAG: CoA transferase [Lapillicoccus sp.]
MPDSSPTPAAVPPDAVPPDAAPPAAPTTSLVASLAPLSTPLAGLRVVTIAVNLPGPVAAARLVDLGAQVTKVEPPVGDPMAQASQSAYAELATGQEVVRLDLKDTADREQLGSLLDGADLLITSSRPSALDRLGLGWAQVHEAHPRLCVVAIVGSPSPDAEIAGHDLTYQAAFGLLDPDTMPRVLQADLAGAERTVTEGLALLVARATSGVGGFAEVALSSAAESMARSLRWGLTVPGGPLGGGNPAYGIYPAREGHVAVAALEPHFRARLLESLEVDGSREAFTAAFATRTASEWEAWALERDLPLLALRD